MATTLVVPLPIRKDLRPIRLGGKSFVAVRGRRPSLTAVPPAVGLKVPARSSPISSSASGWCSSRNRDDPLSDKFTFMKIKPPIIGPLVLIRLAAGAMLGFMLIQTAPAALWITNSPLILARHSHTATLLRNGKVLVAGGVGGIVGISDNAELHDPTTGTNQPTGSLNIFRRNHTATLLLNGKVLVAGGFGGEPLVSAELYDPATGSWTPTGDMNGPREFHTATLLRNGMVLVTGGRNFSGATHGAELYDPVTETWLPTGSLSTNRNLHTATLLPNGQVLVTGGGGFGAPAISTVETYNPASGSWTNVNNMKIARFAHTATLLPSGQVLVAGGAANAPLDGAELFDPASMSWQLTGSLHVARDLHTATLLPNGNVMVAGGFFNGGGTPSVEEYDPATATWTTTNALNFGRWNHTATLIPNGSVLVVGGRGNGGGGLGSVETFTTQIPTAIVLISPIRLANGLFQISFTSTPGTTFTTLAATNPASPLNDWTALGAPAEISSGQFQFTDSQTSDHPRRFYRVRSP